ncbi:LLM class F420-dependent oxidoreductase [Ruicaihuangia caeni]|uniref:LLM class F420-dependent oxidoreductase n=1 Tax=Ruicaihuangia caeni TaxID=3042517 RepID=A0AAW6T1N4_9MICO|nr:LLM class F420-dependent oxidoreductase [Klugiella sp. YN-L-19]MDI2097702.1 LLM class F420-dependent oxidoreductase [Klugiella sp. YN-L-19]
MSNGIREAARPDRPLRIAVQLAPEHARYSTIRDAVARLEDMGVDVLFNWDHFFPLTGDRDGLHFEAWTMVAAWAEQTSRVEFGSLVSCNSYRNANLQADMARTIDHISARDGGQGRFIFGTGAGWFERDYDEYGFEFGTPGSRLNALARDMPVIEQRWAKLNPPPTRRIPVLIGGGGVRKTLRIVAEHADIWHSFSSPEVLAEKLQVLRMHADAVGRDVSEIEVSVELRRASDADADALLDLGATFFTIGLRGPEYDFEKVARWLRWRDERSRG